MKKIIAVEEAAQCAFAILALYYQCIMLPAWLWAVLFFSPDVSMLGYLIGPRAGAWIYNLAHHKGIALSLIVLGWVTAMPVALLIGCLLYAHSSFDRMMGYGLKYEEGFSFTHLGRIGKAAKH